MTVHELDVAWRLVLALGLSSVVGLEREVRHKSAGLRTHALVGLGAALFMLVSTYGFADVLGKHVTLDPSRVAAQIVSGIGFIGGGLIFVRRADVRGLTTAASVWTVAAIGMAAAGDLPVLATLATVMYPIVSLVYPLVTERLPVTRSRSTIQLTYLDGHGLLRRLLTACAEHGFAVSDLEVVQPERDDEGAVTVRLELRGRGSLSELVDDLEAVDGVTSVIERTDAPPRRSVSESTRALRRASHAPARGKPLARN
jgi:putative Mg2+ transporter-C (MgtC) family protein